MMYKALLTSFGAAELLARAASASTDAESARALSNLAMQFRKVCNHPELFERADVCAPFSFCEFGKSGPLNREGDAISVPYSTRNPIGMSVPELFYRDGGLLHVPREDAPMKTGSGPLATLTNIWTVDSIHRSLYEDRMWSDSSCGWPADSAFQMTLPGRSFALQMLNPNKRTHYISHPCYRNVSSLLKKNSTSVISICLSRKDTCRTLPSCC
jgi:hypothetical protein